MRIDGKEFDWKQAGGKLVGNRVGISGKSLETRERPKKVQAASLLKLQQANANAAVKKI